MNPGVPEPVASGWVGTIMPPPLFRSPTFTEVIRDIEKSQIFTVVVASFATRRLDVFKSQWITFRECKKMSPLAASCA
jgi:hypothetical protein